MFMQLPKIGKELDKLDHFYKHYCWDAKSLCVYTILCPARLGPKIIVSCNDAIWARMKPELSLY